MNTFSRTVRSLLGAVLAITLAACGGGGGSSSGTADGSVQGGNGTLRLAMTDAPACGYDQVNVTVEKVRVHQSASAGDNSAGWSEVVLSPAQRIDLLSLTNGVLFELGQTALPAGKYTQMRLVLAENTSSQPFANSVVPTGATETALKTPSGQQSGLKANINIDVAVNQLADFVIDFDACKSVVKAGKSGQYLLKPVLHVIPRFVAGVGGFVAVGIAVPDTTVSLQQAGVVIRSTVPDSSGHFLLQPVPVGTYTLVVAAAERSTLVVNGIVIDDATVTELNLASSALNPPTSPTATLAGTVTTPVSPIEAEVRVLQTLSSGTTIEVAGQPVDGDTGAYSYVVPVNAPLVTTLQPAPLVFTADSGAAGKYGLEAINADGAVKSATPPTLAAGAMVTTLFVFP